MKNYKKHVLAILLTCVSTATLSFEYITGVDGNYDTQLLLLNEQNPSGTFEFLEFNDSAVAFEGYSEPNYEGTKIEINANNVYEQSPHQMQSYKIVETKNASYENSNTLYLNFTSPLCVNAAYAIPSKDVAETSLGEVCYSAAGLPVVLFDLTKLETPISKTDEIEVYLRNKDKTLLSAFDVKLGEGKLVKIVPTSMISTSAFFVGYLTNNLLDFSSTKY